MGNKPYKAKKSLGLNAQSASSETSFKKKKSLGQNFLKSEKALSLMVSAGNVDKEDIILEIGPGKGVLTEKLLEKAKKVIAIEKDTELIEILEEKFKEEIKNGKLEIIHGDCLEFDPTKHPLLAHHYKLIANIPYYITGAIIRKFLESKKQPETVVLLIQKEVAERITGKDPKKRSGVLKESLLSLSVKAYGVPKYIDKVSKRYFSPEPKIDSAIIAITDIGRARFASPALSANSQNNSESAFFNLIHAGFAHKRKVLIKNLTDKGYNKEKIIEQFRSFSIDEKTRAEDICIDTWIELSKNL